MRFILFSFIPAFLLAGSNPKLGVATRTPKPPKIDAVLNEPEWQLAKPITDFIQLVPIEGAQPDEKTEVRFLFDDEALYVACFMHDPDPSKIVARLARRDDIVESDYISIRLDTFHDHQTDFEFTVNAAGVKVDFLSYDDGRRGDASWDAVWDVETRIDEHGWVAEFKIPFKSLRFPPHDRYEWGLQIIRHVSRSNEQLHWALVKKSDTGSASKFGHLVGIENIPLPSNIEILPYTLGSGRFVPSSPASPNGRDLTASAGLDAKYKPTGGITVDATFNPDFGQVEADPAVLNLTTIETFYPEKRPFFVEGSQIMRFSTFGDAGGPGLFYPRRIGRTISVVPPVGGYVLEQPRFATIVGAAKVSGKTSDGTSVGILEALTRRETATLVDSAGARTDGTVEPLANYSLVRLRKDFSGNSNVGMIITSVNRDGRFPANTGGLDWNLSFLDNMYRVDGFLSGSHTTGDSSSRVSGSAGKFSFNKEGGDHWRWTISGDFTSPHFNINDVGFFRRPNDHGTVEQLVFREDLPSEYVRQWLIGSTYHYRTNFDNTELFNAFAMNVYVLMSNYWDFGVEAEIDHGKYDDRETRGNGLFQKAHVQSIWFALDSDPRQQLVLNADLRVGNDQRARRFLKMNAGLEWKLATNATLQFALSHNEESRQFAWFANINDTSISSNVISLFADRTTSDWSLTSRGTIVFARNLTLQYYLQLFFAKGKYENSARLITPDVSVSYGYNEPDFNNMTWNSNLVLRWEYLPGSTMYLVWTQSRNGSLGTYQTLFGDNIANTFSLPATNVFLLKISYWLDY